MTPWGIMEGFWGPCYGPKKIFGQFRLRWPQMDPSCPSDSSAWGSVMGLQAVPQLSPWGVIGRDAPSRVTERSRVKPGMTARNQVRDDSNYQSLTTTYCLLITSLDPSCPSDSSACGGLKWTLSALRASRVTRQGECSRVTGRSRGKPGMTARNQARDDRGKGAG